MNLRTQSALALAIAATLPGVALAHGGGGDIALFNTGGQTDVGFARLDDDDINQLAFDPTDSVFQAVLRPIGRAGIFQPFDFGSSEPGYDANEAVATLPGQVGSGLPASAAVTWRTTGLWTWDGSGAVTFSPATGVNAGYAAPSSGVTDPLGGFHLHPTFGLAGATAASLPRGVYLAEVAATVAGLAESDPFYLVALVDDAVSAAPDETLAESVGETVRDFLSGARSDALVAIDAQGTLKDYAFYAAAVRHVEALAVPEPSALVLLALAPAALRRRVR